MTKLRTKQTKYPVLAGNSKQKTGDGSLPCDKNCNITSGTYGSYTTRYTYDTANQLLREDNQAAGKTWVYTYDNAGNILTKTTYAYTTATNPGTAQDTVTYTYGNSTWGDLLTNYNGKAITYDTIGNPLTYGSRTYTWEHGRQLASLTENGTTWSYTYGADGLRTGKTNGTTTYTYLYKDGKLTYMANQSRKLYFSYDGSGKPYAMWYSGTNYYYVTNLQGDVIGILDNAGNQIVTYIYDAWGNIVKTEGSHASTIGQYNPLRYRGYIYDSETNLYYLQSRYYDPELGRFINADALASTGQGLLGNNMFAYCNNNPVNNFDSNGYLPKPVCEVNVSISGNAGSMGALDEYLRLKESFQKNGIVLYHSIEGALSAWSAIYLPKSEEYEYVTYLYSIETPLGTRYFTSQTYKGTKGNAIMSPNVLSGTFALALQDALYSVNLVAHVHTHPNPGKGFHNDFPSVDQNIFGGDRIVYNLLNLPEMYIIPFKRCDGTPRIIVYSDRNTWCPHYS